MAVTKTTELDAINTMLSAIGEAPINSLETSSNADVSLARNILTEVSKETQSVGWHFNREYDVTLSPTASNEILLADNIASLDVEAANAGSSGTSGKVIQYVQRGDKIYNKTDHTFTITKSLKCNVVYMLEWTDLPQVARHYIMIKAARRLQDRVVGSTSQHQYNAIDEYQALTALKSTEAQEGDYSIFDNYDVYKTVARSPVIDRIVS